MKMSRIKWKWKIVWLKKNYRLATVHIMHSILNVWMCWNDVHEVHFSRKSIADKHKNLLKIKVESFFTCLFILHKKLFTVKNYLCSICSALSNLFSVFHLKISFKRFFHYFIKPQTTILCIYLYLNDHIRTQSLPSLPPRAFNFQRT